MTDKPRSAFRTFDATWLALGVAIVGIAAAAVPLRSWDYWYHLTVGRLLDMHHALPDVDIFSYTIEANTALMVQPWIGKFWLYRLHEVGGLPAAMLARNFCALAAIGIIAIAAYRLSSRNVGVTAGLTLLHGFSFVAVSMIAGPQMFAWPLFTLLLGIGLLVINHRINRWSMLLFIPVAAFWANLAPQFIVPALLAIVFAAAAWKVERDVFVPSAIAAIGSIGAIFATPHGALVANAIPDMGGAEAWLILGAPLLIAPLATSLLDREPKPVSLPLGLAAPAALLCVMVALQPWTEAHRALPAMVFGDAVRQAPPLEGFAPSDTPVDAVEVLRLWGSQPRILAEAHLSGYILNEIQDPQSPEPIVWPSPDHAPSSAVAALQEQLIENPSVARGILQQYGVRAVLVSGDLEPIRPALDDAPEWERVFEADGVTLYQRVRTSNSKPAAK